MGRGQPRLHLQVGATPRREPLLPPAPTRRAAPPEQLASGKPRGGRVAEAPAVAAYGADPRSLGIGDPEEVVGRPGDPGRVGDVGAAVAGGVRRYGHQVETPRGPEVPGVVGGDHHERVVGQGHRGVRPPVDRHVTVGRVGEHRVHEQGAVDDRRVDAPDQAQHALVLPQPQDGACAVDHAGEDRGAGERPMAGEAEVPLRAAGEPGVAERQVPHLEGVRLEQHLTPVDDERPEPAAQVEEEGRRRPAVRDHRGPKRGRVGHPVVAALGVVGKHGPAARDGAVAELGEDVLGGARRGTVVEDRESVALPGQRDVVGQFPEGHRRHDPDASGPAGASAARAWRGRPAAPAPGAPRRPAVP